MNAKNEGGAPARAWTVDASCKGNPGVMEYRCVEIPTGKLVFSSEVYPLGTNNIGEFLALVHAMALMQRQGVRYPIFSDSQTAMAWVRRKSPKTTMEINDKNRRLFQHLHRAVEWLQKNDPTSFDIRKWDTSIYGEIPADYNRK